MCDQEEDCHGHLNHHHHLLNLQQQHHFDQNNFHHQDCNDLQDHQFNGANNGVGGGGGAVLLDLIQPGEALLKRPSMDYNEYTYCYGGVRGSEVIAVVVNKKFTDVIVKKESK